MLSSLRTGCSVSSPPVRYVFGGSEKLVLVGRGEGGFVTVIAEGRRNTQSIVKSPSLTCCEHTSCCRSETALGSSLPGYSATSDVLESKSYSTTQMSELFPTGTSVMLCNDLRHATLSSAALYLGNLSFVQRFLAHLGKAAKAGEEEL